MTPGGSVLVAAGEVSGDRMAAPVVEELGRRWPGLRFFGAGGPSLRQAGVEVRHRVDRLAVTGLTEAGRRLPAAVALLGDLSRQLALRRPRLALLVDYPGVNLRLAAAARALGVPVLYYGAPQRWAWMPWRAAALGRLIDRLAVTLPFEEPWFRRRGINATFVGHPMVDLFRPVPGDGLGLALLPGSRENEIKRHLPPMLEAARRLPRLAPVIAVTTGSATLCRALAPGLPCVDTPAALAASRVALCASGSATLELALAGVPGVICYRVSPVTYRVGRMLVRVRWLGLPNLVLGDALLPELVQREMSPSRLAREALRLLEPQTNARVRAGLRTVAARLGSPGVAGRVADLADELLRRRINPRSG